MKKIIFLVLIIASCKSMEFSTLRFEEVNNKRLPTLRIEIDEYSLENAFSVTSTSGSASQNNSNTSYSETTTLDPRIQDAKVLFERETYANICNETGSIKGIICYEIPIIDKKVNQLIYLFSVFTLSVPNIFGMPFTTYKTDLELETTIKDLEGNIIKKYISHGYGKESSKYFGYTMTDARRLASIKAIKMAMEKNRSKIIADYIFINDRLND